MQPRKSLFAPARHSVGFLLLDQGHRAVLTKAKACRVSGEIPCLRLSWPTDLNGDHLERTAYLCSLLETAIAFA